MKVVSSQWLVVSRSSFCSALCALIIALHSFAEAQQAKRIPRIGFMTAGGAETDVRFESFREGLRDFGYVDGKSILIEFRSADAKVDRIPTILAELVRGKPDVMVITAQPAVRAAKELNITIPIVMLASYDPVATGIIDSLPRPGGNFTGLTILDREISGKRLQLLQETNARTSRVGVLWNAETPGPYQAFKEYEAAARVLKVQLQSMEVRSPADFETFVKDAARERVNALVTARNSVLDRYQDRIAELGVKIHAPSMCERSRYVEAGCLLSYATNEAWSYRRAAYYVHRILTGAKPAELPVEQPTKFELVINLKTAKQIGLTIPQNVLARADKVIK